VRFVDGSDIVAERIAQRTRWTMTASYQSRARRGHAAGLCLTAFVMTGLAPDRAEAGARIVVTYDVVSAEIAPEQRTTRIRETRTYTLSGKNSLNLAGSQIASSSHSLGQETEGSMLRGMHFRATYRVLYGILFIITDFDGYTAIKKITVVGANACVCTLEFRKKSGHQYIEHIRPAGTSFYSDMHTENMTCSITETND
jgi:hypothetical protein